MVGEVENWEELRLAGAAVKERALLGLADHLERLERELIAHGATVHWARDAKPRSTEELFLNSNV
ncbi:hypothetical protein [Saccharopolyspora pogona]|uniref:hypothetical protein n=1 Tax=Saccharopolyspora pogona TaxID=333966 RepID=UPI00168823EC|nr:hypothetical protein [Saccharopolyspora pogona]